jgi:hypothetical protein
VKPHGVGYAKGQAWQGGHAKGFMDGSVRPALDKPYTKLVRAINIQTGAIFWLCCRPARGLPVRPA